MEVLNEEPKLGYSDVLGEHANNPPEPRQVGEKVYALDQWFTISSDEMRLKAQFEEWLRKQALQGIKEIYESFGMEDGAAARDTYVSDRASGYYNWGGKYCIKALRDAPGILHQAFLFLRRCHPDITEKTVMLIIKENGVGLGAAMNVAMGNWDTPPSNGMVAGMNGNSLTNSPSLPIGSLSKGVMEQLDKQPNQSPRMMRNQMVD